MEMRSREAISVEKWLWARSSKKQLATEAGMKEFLEMGREGNITPFDLAKIKPMVKMPELSAFEHKCSATLEKKLIYGVETFMINHREAQPSIIYFHGGAYVNQIYSCQLELVDKLALATNCTGIIPLYPLTPTYSCTESHTAIHAWYDYMIDKIGSRPIILMGDSAGGSFALSLAMYLRDHGRPLPRRLILISPALDFQCNNPEIDRRGLEDLDPILTKNFSFVCKVWARERSLEDPMVNPMYGDLKGLPPITLYTGTRELFWPDAEKFRDKAAQEGVALDYREWPEMLHCFSLLPTPEALKAQDEMIELVSQTISSF